MRVTAPRELRRERIARREVGSLRDGHLVRSDELERTLDRVQLEDFATANDGRPIRAVAPDVLEQLGWLYGVTTA